MTAKDFMLIADVISNFPRENRVRFNACQDFADALRLSNPRFDERRFMDACHVSQLVIPAKRVKVGDHICSWGKVARIVNETRMVHGVEEDCVTFYFTGDSGVDKFTGVEQNLNDPIRIEREV